MRWALFLLAGCSSSSFCDTFDGGTPTLMQISGDCSPTPIYFAVVNGGGSLPYHLQLSPECVAMQRGECVVDATCNDGARIHADNGRIDLTAPTCKGSYSVTYK